MLIVHLQTGSGFRELQSLLVTGVLSEFLVWKYQQEYLVIERF